MSNANAERDWRIYADFARHPIGMARELYAGEELPDLEGLDTVYALNSSTIDLCLSVFPWAPFRSTKAAVKLHTLLGLRGSIPSFIFISDGKACPREGGGSSCSSNGSNSTRGSRRSPAKPRTPSKPKSGLPCASMCWWLSSKSALASRPASTKCYKFRASPFSRKASCTAPYRCTIANGRLQPRLTN